MKLTKVENSKHYVECGLACSNCSGQGKMWVGYDHVKKEPIYQPCLECHGTGVQAVEDWPDARKAEWLKANNPVDGVLTISPSGVGWSVSFIGYDVNEYPIPSPSGDDAWGEDEDFSATLTAAVINVAKEEK